MSFGKSKLLVGIFSLSGVLHAQGFDCVQSWQNLEDKLTAKEFSKALLEAGMFEDNNCFAQLTDKADKDKKRATISRIRVETRLSPLEALLTSFTETSAKPPHFAYTSLECAANEYSNTASSLSKALNQKTPSILFTGLTTQDITDYSNRLTKVTNHLAAVVTDIQTSATNSQNTVCQTNSVTPVVDNIANVINTYDPSNPSIASIPSNVGSSLSDFATRLARSSKESERNQIVALLNTEIQKNQQLLDNTSKLGSEAETICTNIEAELGYSLGFACSIPMTSILYRNISNEIKKLETAVNSITSRT